jgi:hypothetical protein
VGRVLVIERGLAVDEQHEERGAFDGSSSKQPLRMSYFRFSPFRLGVKVLDVEAFGDVP